MSTLRARCPDCRTLTAVAFGSEYQCHSCGREFSAGLVRVPRAPGVMEATRWPPPPRLALPYPEAAVIDEMTVEEQAATLVRNLPTPPLVLGGCCCAHIGAIRGSLGASRVSGSRVDRCAWRPEHAGKLGVGKPVGHAAQARHLMRVECARRTSHSWAHGTPIRPSSEYMGPVGSPRR